ncbi:serine/threonine protein kinase [Halioxenophilus sp. WMMB6]|uniref:serine/threonine protein kinase n=1 Tax=Halioxenophilus sp. WMMB6 TaxID=3073815 RepID=UPI00295F2E04|nr:protein kinase [Halioxenophilus sp. WMMB6]
MASTDHRLALATGTVLQQYRIESVLGYGGFGIVYKGRHLHLDEIVVALKEYLPQEISTREGCDVVPLSNGEQDDYEAGLQRFLTEAKQLVAFNHHPNIVSCRDFFEANGTAYLVMDFENGVPLSDLLKQRQLADEPFSEAEILAIMLPLLDGLATIHRKQVLHRDIKPGNIFIRHDTGAPVLIDFGAAKQDFSQHSKSNAPYTIGYAAFEQVHNEGLLGPWTDLHAIGGVIWRIIKSANPPDVNIRVNAIMRGQPDPMLTALATDTEAYSDAFLEAVAGCLCINEEDRWQSAEALIAALNESAKPAKQTSQTGTTASEVEPPSPPTSANRALPVLGLLLGIALLLIVAIVVMTGQNPEVANDAQPPTTAQTSSAGPADTPNEPAPDTGHEPPASSTGSTAETTTSANPPAQTLPAASYRLWVKASPFDAQVAFTNTSSRYVPGIELPAGTYHLQVSRAGYQTQTVTIDLSRSDQTISVQLQPEQASHKLWLTLEPATAEVKIAGVSAPYRPGMTLPAGDYRLKISAPGYETATLNANLSKRDQRLSVTLQKAGGSLAWKNCQATATSTGTGEAYFELPAGLSADSVKFKVGRFPLELLPVTFNDQYHTFCKTSNCYKVRYNFGLFDYSASAGGRTTRGKACFYSVDQPPHVYPLQF